ncbi:MAG: 50S ribosomal protein L10 [Candidatus Dojkabacteria bacterium]|nr:MAG: 50S ribosomal protein L10 [Candidatus Dojkabacteria bacterium]
MAKSKDQKTALLEQYKSLLTENKGYIAVDTEGVDTTAVTELKKKLREIGSTVTVVKNNIFKIALDETKSPVETKDFDFQTAVITYDADPTVVAKLIKDVQKDTEKFEARFGVVEGKFVEKSKVMGLAEIPSREELLAKMLGSMIAPVSGVMNAVTGNVRGFAQVLSQLGEKGEQKA